MSLVSERQKYINTIFPIVLTNLISEYEYYLKGEYNILFNNQDPIECMTILPNGRIVMGTHNNELKIFDPKTNKCDFILQGHSDAIMCVKFIPNTHNQSNERCEGRIISGSLDKTIKIWNSEIECVNDNYDYCLTYLNEVYAFDVFPNGSIVTGLHERNLRISNYESISNKDIILTGHNKTVYCVTTLPDGRIVSGSTDNTLKIWNIQSGQHNKSEITLIGHSGSILCIEILSDCKEYRIVSGSSDQTLKIWNPFKSFIQSDSVNYCDITLTGHSSTVYCVNVLPDGRLISGSYDSTIKIWNVNILLNTYVCEMTLTGHSDVISCINILPDKRIISGSHDGTIMVWR